MEWLRTNAETIGAISTFATALFTLALSIFTFVLVYIARSNLKAFLDELKQNTELRRADLIHSINANLSTYRRLRQWLIKEKNPDPKTDLLHLESPRH